MSDIATAHFYVDADISAEDFREYKFVAPDGRVVAYRIDSPERLIIPRPDSTTHRVVGEDGIIHIVPAIGQLGCVVCISGPVLF